jgi:uncharacterized protein (TIGR02391 family)
MNLETQVNHALWEATKTSYESGNYTAAILDSIYLVTEVLREKSDSDADGVVLVGYALGGTEPRIKITPLRSESDWNEQKGLEHLLRGLYQGIRNPRSHGFRGDSQGEADSLIIFIDYILGKLGNAKALFSKQEFLERLVDQHFLHTAHYARLIINEIPAKYRLEVFHDFYQRRRDANGDASRYILQALLERLSEGERTQVWTTISLDLRTAESPEDIRSVVQMISPEQWTLLSEISRLRIENRFVNEVKTGAYSVKKARCQRGALGTWCTSLLPYFTLKAEIGSALINSLGSNDREAQDYVFQYFFPSLIALRGKGDRTLRRLLEEGLGKGDKRFLKEVSPLGRAADDEWGDTIVNLTRSFKEQPQESDWDDLPF